jgi:hypothetical protein
MIERIEATAHKILGDEPEPVVRFRLLRDVLRTPAEDPDLQAAQDALKQSQQLKTLAKEQRRNGSWGRFHTADSQVKKKIITTEAGVDRAFALGLDASHPVLKKAADYILQVMEGEKPFPDRAEVNDRWELGMRLFLGSTLSKIYPRHPALIPERALWQAIATRTFQRGAYNENSEIKAHSVLTGATVKDSYLRLNGKYQVALLGSDPRGLAPRLELTWLNWLWNLEEGIGYLGVSLSGPPPTQPVNIDRWLESLELLANAFPSWREQAKPAIDWLWKQQDTDGFWDFGPRPATLTNMPFSDSWRRRVNRPFDWSTRVLVLLRKACD